MCETEARELPHQDTANLINLRLMLQQIISPSTEIITAKQTLDQYIATAINTITQDTPNHG